MHIYYIDLHIIGVSTNSKKGDKLIRVLLLGKLMRYMWMVQLIVKLRNSDAPSFPLKTNVHTWTKQFLTYPIWLLDFLETKRMTKNKNSLNLHDIRKPMDHSR